MKKFQDYTPALDNKKVKKLKEKDFINIVGGEENYKLMIEYKLINEEFTLDDTTKFFGNMFSGAGSLGSIIGKRLTIEIVASFIRPMLKKIGINPNGLFGYMVAYGTQYAVNELGTSIIDPSKQKDFCRAFSIGASKSIEEWATYNGFSNLFAVFGIEKSNNPFARTIVTSLKDILLTNTDTATGKTSSIIQKFICETKFDIGGKQYTMWEYISDFFKNNYTKLAGF